MKLKEIKCPCCNASIKLKENETKGICEYCKSEFILDDETIRIEHTGTIEITDDTSLKIAETTLNKFKDYDQSLILYKRLLYKYAYKKEVYIGLIRSITKDFKLENINKFQLNEINNYWHKYKTLADDKEINKYEKAINKLNKDYWYNTLIKMTNNFNNNDYNEKLKNIEHAYNNYIVYCNEKDKSLINNKYQEYINNYKIYLNQRNRQKNSIIKWILISIVTILIIIITFLLTENTEKLEDKISLSEINEHYYQNNNDKQYFKKYFKKTISNIEIVELSLNNEDKSVDIKVLIKNILREKTKTFNFKIIDNTGPIIEPMTCTFMDTEDVDLYKCFSLYDFTDGKIEKEKAIIDTKNNDFKTEGTKIINIKISDKDGNQNSLDIPVIITKTPITLNLNISDNLIVSNTYNISHDITPNVKDKTVSYTYDKNLIEINNGKLKVIRKGQTEICAISNYNQDVKVCKKLNLELQCKNTYIFNFDGSKEETITSNEMFCPGTYKIYASVMNKNNFYHLKIKPKDAFVGETLTIYKNSSFLNEEGSKYTLTEGYNITTEIGITQVKLIKIK